MQKLIRSLLRRRGLKVMGLVVALALAAAPAQAATSGLDTSFGRGGKTTIDFGKTDSAVRVLVQHDGRLVIAGGSRSDIGDGEFSLARLSTNGRLDSSFDGDGRVTTNPAPGSVNAVDAAIGPDDKVVVLGNLINTVQGETQGESLGYVLVRYRTDGSIDSAFGLSGLLAGTLGRLTDEIQHAGAVAVQRDGKVLALGDHRARGSSRGFLSLVRYNANGALDLSFGSHGRVDTPLGGFEDGRALTLQPNGQILVVSLTKSAELDAVGLVRYLRSGDLDTSFGRRGMVITPATNGTSLEPEDVLVQRDGKVVVVGARVKVQPFSYDFAVLRYLVNGKLDPTFSGDGKTYTSFTSMSFASSVAQQTDGKLVVAGAAYDGGRFNFALVRYTLGGALDSSFDDGGRMITQFRGDSGASSIIVQRNGKLTAAGSVTGPRDGDFAVARYNP